MILTSRWCCNHFTQVEFIYFIRFYVGFKHPFHLKKDSFLYLYLLYICSTKCYTSLTRQWCIVGEILKDKDNESLFKAVWISFTLSLTWCFFCFYHRKTELWCLCSLICVLKIAIFHNKLNHSVAMQCREMCGVQMKHTVSTLPAV